MKAETSYRFRILHRYLGFFLAGIMAVYSISGIILIYRNTDFLKKTETKEVTIDKNLSAEQIGEKIGNRRLKIEKQEGDLYYFENGQYNASTGEAKYTEKRLPLVLEKMTHLHKAKSGEKMYYFNIFFGMSLLFFVLSAFWMFMPGTTIFKKGLYYTLAGIVLTVILLFI